MCKCVAWIVVWLFLVAGSPIITNSQESVGEQAIVWIEDGLWNESRGTLWVTQVAYDGVTVSLNRPFTASPDWLRRLTIRVQNRSSKPIVYLAIKVGLLGGVDEELAPTASWQHGFGYIYGERHKEQVATTSQPRLEPGEEVVLGIDQVAPRSIDVLERSGGLERFRRAEIWAAEVQYATGKTQRGGVGFLRGLPTIDLAAPPN